MHPGHVLYDGEHADRIRLPVCDHYAGSEKLIRKSLALQAQLAVAQKATFDITFDCEDGAAAGRETEQAALVATLLQDPANLFDRCGVRVHDPRHAALDEELDIIVGRAGQRVAYVTFPKLHDAAEAHDCVARLNAVADRHGIARRIPAHVLIETHGALREVFDIAAVPQIECLSFGLMDFVSAHHGAIPDAAMTSPGQFDHPLVRRAKVEIAAACHAFGKVASHNVTTDFGDTEAARADARRASREFGYTRMWSIHPSQIASIVGAFAPAPEAVEEAADILLAAQAAQWGPTQRAGRLHDRASYRYYWEVLQQAALVGAALPERARSAFFASA
ncbi:HpcH/HpaI aldolase/citrate lyase family protein [Derxia gummosa]|uniref:HpcH/HpaI aldolase/citrate lyase family protein n=1 Tax=Derxia gummosa DSM 723 TaxID=1121388 RepID=A0A8B6X6R3_9BURK|nr:aldolase/citrate lyase family protein [Derxia gummosa]